MKWSFSTAFFVGIALLFFYGRTAQTPEGMTENTYSLPFDYSLPVVVEEFRKQSMRSMEDSIAVQQNEDILVLLGRVKQIRDVRSAQRELQKYADEYISILNERTQKFYFHEPQFQAAMNVLYGEYQSVLETLQRMHEVRVKNIKRLSYFVTEFKKSRRRFDQDVRFWNSMFIEKVFVELDSDPRQLLMARDLLPLHKDVQNAADVMDQLYGRKKNKRKAEPIYENQRANLKIYLNEEEKDKRAVTWAGPSVRLGGDNAERRLWQQGLASTPQASSDGNQPVLSSAPITFSVDDLLNPSVGGNSSGGLKTTNAEELSSEMRMISVPFLSGERDPSLRHSEESGSKVSSRAFVNFGKIRQRLKGMTQVFKKRESGLAVIIGALAAVVVLWKLNKYTLKDL